MAKSKPRSKRVGISKWLSSLLGIGTLAGAALIGSSLFNAMESLDDRSQAAFRRMPTTGTVCWDKAVSYNGRLMWPDGCRGQLDAQMCTQAFTPLSETEMVLYKQWVAQGKPIVAGCVPGLPAATPKETPLYPSGNSNNKPAMTGRPVRTAEPVRY